MRGRARAVLAVATALALYAFVGAARAETAGGVNDTRRLYLEQQQDSLNLQLRQSSRAPAGALHPADARRLEQLHLEQRIELQQLELQQLQRYEALRQGARALPPDLLERRIGQQRAMFAQERELQNQRFELDQQRLLQSARRQPLQPPIGSGQLYLP